METPDTQRIILDSIADGVFSVDTDWNITSFNRAAEEITGVPRDQAIGEKCFNVFRADVCQTMCTLRRTIETGQEIVGQRVTILNSRGEEVPISISTAVLRDAHGNLTGGVETFRDLTAIETLRQQLRDSYALQGIISKNHVMHRIFDILPDIAESGSTVLVEGASGTGKELIARALHELSPRKDHRFVAVNCGALPETLLESELFGYKKGAFTDAHADKPGRFAVAERGTLFLDEIGDMPHALQVKLLRVLQEREYEPLGATEPVQANVRIIAATNRSLQVLVAQKTFRDDLYYRLNVVRLHLPPLRERREDIPLLAGHFVQRLAAERGKPIRGLSDEALEVLMHYEFPGNIRELENIIEHAFVLCREPLIFPWHLPGEVLAEVHGAPHASAPQPETREFNPLRHAEATALLEALHAHNGNREQTAAALGIHKTTLWRKMKKYGIQIP